MLAYVVFFLGCGALYVAGIMPPRRMKCSAGINGDDVRGYRRSRAFLGENPAAKSTCGTGNDLIGNTNAKRVYLEDSQDRVLMRQWLEDLANAGTLAGLQWLDQQNSLVKINWKHASKSGWSKDDSEVFVKWAQYTGLSSELFLLVRGHITFGN